MINLAQRYFYEPCSDLYVLLLFSFECRIFLSNSSILFAYMEQLAGHMAVFISKSSCGMYKLSLAANFKLLLELLHLTDIMPDFRSSFDPLGPDSVS